MLQYCTPHTLGSFTYGIPSPAGPPKVKAIQLNALRDSVLPVPDLLVRNAYRTGNVRELAARIPSARAGEEANTPGSPRACLKSFPWSPGVWRRTCGTNAAAPSPVKVGSIHIPERLALSNRSTAGPNNEAKEYVPACGDVNSLTQFDPYKGAPRVPIRRRTPHVYGDAPSTMLYNPSGMGTLIHRRGPR